MYYLAGFWFQTEVWPPPPVADDLNSVLMFITDVLLCHDDELDSRRIAFAFYLVPTWTREDGGTLDLFDMDGL